MKLGKRHYTFGGFWEDFGSDCFAKRNDGCTVLHAAIDGEHYRKLDKKYKMCQSFLKRIKYERVLLYKFPILFNQIK